MVDLSFVASVLHCACPEDKPIAGVSTDSRTLTPGALFIALSGERFDGHDHIPDAISRGAAAVVCSRVPQDAGVPCLVVQDTLKALADLARAYRKTLSCPVIALTGSNGKTTVKEMIASILPEPSHATRGNLNNHIGAPLSVLQWNAAHRYAVFELGANHPGEIAFTAGIVQPDIALVNSIAPAHIAGFGSIEGVANAKGEIYAALASSGTAIVNEDDSFAHFWDSLTGNRRVIRFSMERPADVMARDVRYDATGCPAFILEIAGKSLPVTLKVPGAHSVRNALAAASCAHAAGIDPETIVRGLARFAGVPGRLRTVPGKGRSTVIDDTYNANLNSVLAGIDVLAARAGRRILVLGDMGELGDYSQEHHEAVGKAARERGIDSLMTCGKYSAWASATFGEGARHFEDKSSLVDALLGSLDAETTVLVKGSRSAAMEKIVNELMG